MKILALIHKNVKIDIKDNFQEGLQYMADHDAPFNLDYRNVTTRIKDMGSYCYDNPGYDAYYLVYDPDTEKTHACETHPLNKEVCWGIIPGGSVEDISDNSKYLSISIAHELIHCLAYLLELKFGIRTNVNAIMDTYYKNLEWNAVGGNFSQSWALLKPHLELLFPDYLIDNIRQWKLDKKLEIKAALFLSNAKLKGYNLRITQGWRDPIYQDKLYAQGRTLPGKIVTNATGKQSKHCLGRAFDFAFIGKVPYPECSNWKAIGQIGKDVGLIWGGDFKSFVDKVHFEI